MIMDQNSSQSETPADEGVSPHTWSYIDITLSCLYFLIGFPGNLLILRVQSAKATKTTTDIFIIALAITDLVSCLLRLENAVSILLDIYAGMDQFGIFGFFCSKTVLFATACLTAAIAFDRYDTICCHSNRTMTHRKAVIVSFSCLGISMLMMVPDIVYFIVDVGSQPRAIVIFIPVSLYLVSKCVVIAHYLKIYKFVRTQSRKIHIAARGMPDDGFRQSGLLKGNQQASTIQEEQSKVPQTISITAKAHVDTECNLEQAPEYRPIAASNPFPTPATDNSNSAICTKSPVGNRYNPHLSTNPSDSGNSAPKLMMLDSPESVHVPSSSEALDVSVPTSDTGIQSVTPTRKAESNLNSSVPSRTKSSQSLDLPSKQSEYPTVVRSNHDPAVAESMTNPVSHFHQSTKKTTRCSLHEKQGFRQQRVTKMLLLATTAFFILWSPYLAYETYSLLNAIYSEGGNIWHVHDAAFVVMSKVVYVNSIINPFIYSFANKRFKKESKAYLQSVKPRCCKLSS